MAERVDLGVVYRAKVETRLPVADLPDQVQSDLKSWVGKVIERKGSGFEWVHGGGFGGYIGLDKHIGRRLQDIAPQCDRQDACGLEVELAGVGGGDVAACAFELRCPRIEDADESLVNEREARCLETHHRMAAKLLSWTHDTARYMESLEGTISEAESTAAAARNEIDKLL